MRRSRPFGPYRLLYRVASGGMAELYRARLGAGAEQRDVALKRPLPVYNDDDEFIVMMTDEARITALFDHPNITRTLEFGRIDGQYFLAMEYVDGVDLRAVIKRAASRREAVPATVFAWVVEQALRGLHHAHEVHSPDGGPLGLVHRDFSPSNIVIGFDGAVKLIDFGIAKAAFNKARTRAGFIKGKVRYMSPEQTRSAPLDRRSDVFSAGVALYSAITGRLPFRGADDNEVIDAIRTREPPPPSAVRPDELDAGFDRVIARALAKDRDDRFTTAAAFADALAGWSAHRGAHDQDIAAAALLSRMFAQEQAEAEALYRSYDDRADDARTPTDQSGSFTRVLGPEDDDDDRDLAGEVDAWLAARRADDGSWTGDHRPSWVDRDDTAPGVPSALDGDEPTGSTVDEMLVEGPGTDA